MPRARTAIAVSPHLDDAVFSAGGVLAVLARAGWHVQVVTCFTASVDDPSPFALATQLDKGLPADADYMALRRAEDRAAQQRLGTLPPAHLPLPEAPHRGYRTPQELFEPPHADDTVETALRHLLHPYAAVADLVLAPQAIGHHVDHLLTARAVASLAPSRQIAWWRDMPYAARTPTPHPAPEPRMSRGVSDVTVDIAAVLAAKIAAAQCYATQLGFQFGGSERTRATLDRAARREAARSSEAHTHGERLQAGPTARHMLDHFTETLLH